MKFHAPISAVAEKLSYTRKLFHDLNELVNDSSQTYFPDQQRKSRWSILRDQLLWIFRNKELNRYYYVYGLDRRYDKSSKEYLGYRKFRRMRDTANLHPKGLNFNYACIMRDKFVFGQFLKSLNIPTPKNIGLLNKQGITWIDGMKQTSYDQIARIDVDGFCKKLMGLKGEGAFALRTQNGEIFVGDKKLSVSALREKIQDEYLWQERVTQHHEMARLHPPSINTIRLLTFNNHGNIELFCGAMRIGTKGRPVDNWGAGGIAVGIDIATGTLRDYGKYKPGGGGRVYVHPNTGISLAGFKIPFYKESVKMVCDVHRYLYGIHSIGWDVAITENGPVLLEGNEGWDGSLNMSLEQNFKNRFLAMYKEDEHR